MKTEKPFDLAAAVNEYIATATAEQVAQDLRDSGFAEYKGIGSLVASPIVPASGATAFVSSFSWSKALEAKPISLAMPFSSGGLHKAALTTVAGTHEDLPLAA